MTSYLDFGTPISFGYTAQYLDRKTQTRREWKNSHAAKFCNAFDRAAAAGQQLRVPAINKGYHAGGKQIGSCVITERPYRQRLSDMPDGDLLAEGGMSATVSEFISQYFKGNTNLEVWVIRFRFQEINKQCLELSNFSVVSVVSDSDLNQSGDSNSIKPSKSAQARKQCTHITLPTLQSGTTCEPFIHPVDNSTASLVAAPVKTLADAEKSKDLTAIDLLSGGRCYESSMNASPLSSAGKMLRERCTEELEKLLPLSEWSTTKSRAQSSYRQRSSEPHISEKGFSLLPIATTYPSGNTKISLAGRNKLESTLRSLVPTPRANDGSQGYNSGKTGGMNLTGYLLATPQNANSPTLLGNLKGDQLATPSDRDLKGLLPTKKKGAGATLSDNVHSFIQPTESANPQVWGWMMGFPKNWCESVLMPPIGLLESADRDGGKKVRHKLLDCQENEFKGGEIQSTTTELLASPPKPFPSPCESDTCPILKTTTLQVMTSSKSDEHNTPAFLAIAARSVMGGIDLDPMSNPIANETISAHRIFTKQDDGLTKRWLGRVWLNPPFSLADHAVPKLIASYESGDVFEAVLLLKSAVETKRYQLLYDYPFVELNKRINYSAPGNKAGAPFATVLFYFGSNFTRWREVMSVYGRVHPGARLFRELESDCSELLVRLASVEALVRR
jgi:hypothetical protein